MRTTLTIDDELFHKVREEAARTRRRVRDVLNDRLRLGYAKEARSKQAASKFVVKPFATKGFAPGVDEQKLNQLVDVLDIDQRKT
jgi:hypothetical protein